MSNSLALYTTVYPGAEQFLSTWYESVRGQTDRGFDIWMGVDQIEPDKVFQAIGHEFDAHWVQAAGASATPAGVRQAAIDAMLASPANYEAIVFLDCDDVMYPSRIQAARKQVQTSDVAGCAMEIADRDGNSRGLYFQPGPESAIPQVLAKVNVFGMSNSTYRTDMLHGLPAVDSKCRLMDWFIAAAAWIRGARFHFDHTPLMQYRQYGNNAAPVLVPFSAADIHLGTVLVLEHYQQVLSAVPDIPDSIRSELETADANVQLFQRRVVEVPDVCTRYIERLNRLKPSYLWWEWIAHPSLEELWKN